MTAMSLVLGSSCGLLICCRSCYVAVYPISSSTSKASFALCILIPLQNQTVLPSYACVPGPHQKRGILSYSPSSKAKVDSKRKGNWYLGSCQESVPTLVSSLSRKLCLSLAGALDHGVLSLLQQIVQKAGL